MATWLTLPRPSKRGKKVEAMATRRPSATLTCVSSRGSYQMGPMVTVSPANARWMRSSTPLRSAISSRRTLYSGGGSEPKRFRKAWLTSRQRPLAS